MKKRILASLLALPATTFAQDSKWQISAQFQPELTIYRERYVNEGALNRATLNYGGALGAQYRFNKRIFAGVGLACVSRTYNTIARFDQGALPLSGPISAEGVSTRQVTYRVVSVPLGIGCTMFRRKAISAFATAGISANYLLNASYRLTSPRYNGTYAKNELQGCSVSAGAGLDYRITKRFSGTTSLSYVFLNPMKNDRFLNGPHSKSQALTYRAANLGIGLKMSL